MKEKIEGILRDLLSKIPVIGERFAQKNSDDEEYEDGTTEVEIREPDDDDDEEEAEAEAEESDELEEDELDDEEEALAAKKKKRTMIIRVVAGLIFAYLAADTFLSDSSDQPGQDPEVTQPSKQDDAIAEARRKRQEAKQRALEEKKAQEQTVATPTETPEVAQPEPVATPEVAQPEPVATPEVAQPEPVATPEVAQPDSVPTSEVTSSEQSVDNEGPADVETPAEEGKRDELIDQAMNQVDSSADTVPEEVTPPPAPTPPPSVGEQSETVVEKADKYVSPPDYEERGRGLVYNCKGKHWACVNRKAYFQCRKNERWQNQVGKALECHIDKTYASNEDCETVQKYKVNMNVPADFCGN